MTNMSYCRFRNTLNDLEDCMEYINEKCENEEEERARERMQDIIINYAEELKYSNI